MSFSYSTNLHVLVLQGTRKGLDSEAEDQRAAFRTANFT